MTSWSTAMLNSPVHGSEQKYRRDSDRESEVVDFNFDPFSCGGRRRGAHDLVELVGERLADLLAAFEVPSGAVLDRPVRHLADGVELDAARLEQLCEVEEVDDLSEVLAHHDVDGDDLDVR